MPVTPPENRESARASDVKKGHQAETVRGIEAGSSGPHGIRFPVHDHPDYSVVTKGKLK